MLNKKFHILKVVVDSGSFTSAAKKLYTSQPAISRDIKQLEEEYEITLFESTKNKLKLTSEGEILYRYAVEMDVINEHLINDIHQITKQVSGDIRIGASYSFGEFVLPQILIDIHHEYPGLNCHVHVGNSQDIIDQLKEKMIDIGIIEIEKTYKGIELHPLFKDEMMLMMPQDFLGNKHYMARYKCFVREPYSGTRFYQEETLKNMNIDPTRVEINNTELIKSCVRHDMGFTILSKLALERENLSEISVQPTGITRNFSIAVSKSKYITLKTQALLDLIKSYSK